MRSMRLSRETKKLFKVRRRFSWSYVLVLLLLLLLIVSYMVYDSNRMVLETLRFSMPTLPKEMEGYTILHVSDIHEFDFGSEGERLVAALGDKKPSCAVVSGGLVDEEGRHEGFLQLLAYLQEQKIPCYYVLGEHDQPYTDFLPDGSYGVCEIYREAAELGAIYLEKPAKLCEGETSLWLMPASSLLMDTESAVKSLNALKETYENDEAAVEESGHSLEALLESIDYRRRVAAEFEAQMDLHAQNDLNIFLTHLPVMPPPYQQGSTAAIYQEADLILAGHNHGGVCLPLLGCIRVHNDEFPRNGWMPGNNLVSGLSDASGWNQYISPGLGTGSSKWYSYRVFTTPTITLIELTRSVA